MTDVLWTVIGVLIGTAIGAAGMLYCIKRALPGFL